MQEKRFLTQVADSALIIILLLLALLNLNYIANAFASFFLIFPRDFFSIDYLAFSAWLSDFDRLVGGDSSYMNALFYHSPAGYAIQYPLYALTGSKWFFHMAPVVLYPAMLLLAIYYFRGNFKENDVFIVLSALLFSSSYALYILVGRPRELIALSFSFFPLLLLGFRFVFGRPVSEREKIAMICCVSISFLANSFSPLLILPYSFFVVGELLERRRLDFALVVPYALFVIYWGSVYLFGNFSAGLMDHEIRIRVNPISEAAIALLILANAHFFLRGGSGLAAAIAAALVGASALFIMDLAIGGNAILRAIPIINVGWESTVVPFVGVPFLIFLIVLRNRSGEYARIVANAAAILFVLSTYVILVPVVPFAVFANPGEIEKYYSVAEELNAEADSLSSIAPPSFPLYRDYNIKTSEFNSANLSFEFLSMDLFQPSGSDMPKYNAAPIELMLPERYFTLAYAEDLCDVFNTTAFSFSHVIVWNLIVEEYRNSMTFEIPERIYVISNLNFGRRCNSSEMEVGIVEKRGYLSLYEIRFAHPFAQIKWNAHTGHFERIQQNTG